MVQKLTIASAGNTVVPAFLTLKAKGYEVRCDRSKDANLWIAETQTIKLIAEDPITLLALSALAESRGENWRASDTEIKQFLSEHGDESAKS